MSESYFGLVWWEATRLKRTGPPDVELDDLVSDGSIGLLQAAERFDPRRNVPFIRFALPYIRWAMIDGLRSRRREQRRRQFLRERATVCEIDPGIARLELKDQIESFLRPLSPTRRRIVSMYFWLDLRMNEIAKALGVSEARISQQISTSLRQMRRTAA